MTLDVAEFLTLDVEASSLYGDSSYPISIGIAGPKDTWYRVICPLPEWEDWDELAAMLHGIERDFLLAQGRDAFFVARELNALLKDQTVLVDSEWDVFWVKKLFDEVGVTLAFSVELLSQHVSKAESDQIYQVIEDVEWPHVANEDAVLLRRIIVAAHTHHTTIEHPSELTLGSA